MRDRRGGRWEGILQKVDKTLQKRDDTLQKRNETLQASYTVEAAGVMAVILITLMILLNEAFHVRAETAGAFQVHEAAEQERHEIAYQEESEVTGKGSGLRWGLDLTVGVFRPEESLRMWSLAERKGQK